MRNMLAKIGIDLSGDFIYEFEAQPLDWWDAERRTSIEFEVVSDEEKHTHLSIVFCPEDEGITERTTVMMTILEGEAVKDTLVAKLVFEQLGSGLTLSFLEDYNAYTTNSPADTATILNCFVRLLKLKEPIYVLGLNETDDEAYELEAGDSISHFLAMLTANEADISKESIVKTLELAISIEGKSYLEGLRADLASGFVVEFEEDFDLTKAEWSLVQDVLKNYA
ncbi:MAG: hypothetical protein EAZ95_00730 [Bacteroidetes bacterium]|nr:MAG: hypothetical protein EAZ95_00730 [Bacteroidota bacterium]